MPKHRIRDHFLSERRALSEEIVLSQSRLIQGRLLDSAMFREAVCLALYCAVNNEVRTEEVARRALELGKTVAYPRVNGDRLEFARIGSLRELAPGYRGIPEPNGVDLLEVAQFDLVVVPGVAFDRSGHRLGYGRGFYDRALAECRPDCARVGFAYEAQVVGALPVAAHDVPLTTLMTEMFRYEFPVAPVQDAGRMSNNANPI